MKRKNSYAQSFLEYAFLVIVVLALFLGMRIYLERATQARYRASVDVYGAGEQYARGRTLVVETNNATSFPEVYSGPELCDNLRARVAALEYEINTKDYDYVGYGTGTIVHVHGLIGLAADLNTRADKIDVQVAAMESQGRTEQAEMLRKTATALREKAENITKKLDPDTGETGEIDRRQTEIDTYTKLYLELECFS